jgi:drug/metabolite transporter (DMT)-like permease
MWVILSFLSAFFLASSDTVTKYTLRDENEYLITWLRYIFSLPVLFLLLPLIKIPELDRMFWLATAVALPLEILAIVLYIKAIKVSDLSIVLPFLSLTPVFLIFFSWIILGEKVSAEGTIGIILVATGGYTLQASSIKKGLLEPLRVLFRNRGVLYMIAVAFVYSITSSLGKLAILHSSALFFPILYFTLVTVFFSPLVCLNLKGDIYRKNNFRRDIKGAVLAGTLYGLMIITHMIAISISNVAYMIAIKRSSMLMGSIYGFVIFKEKGVKERIFGASLMLAGIVLIIMGSD